MKTSILYKFLRWITPQTFAVFCYLAGFPHVPGRQIHTDRTPQEASWGEQRGGPRMSRATVLLPHCRVLLYHLNSTRITTVPVPRLSVLSMPTLLPKMRMGGQLLLGNKRRMHPRLWTKKKKRTKESMAEMKIQWDSSVAPRTYKIEKERKI
jgi:hypothetical protein